ncbi:Uncharacterised protein [uncultured archaeon]|nr:Uncharacterised protein [uncultured archaeon]
MELYGSFEEKGYKIESYFPTNLEEEKLEWIVKIYRDNKLERELSIPMDVNPLFGVDIFDLKTLDERVDELLKLLP